MQKIAIFASGSGSNFEALIHAVQGGTLAADPRVLIVDQPEAYAIERAKKLQIPVEVLLRKDFSSKEAFEQAIIEQLEKYEIDYIVLAGYMRLIGSTILEAYPNRIINIHPSLLPSFPGKDAIGQAVEHGVKVTGVTVHYVDAGMDTGPIIMQRAVDVVEGSVEKTAQAIHHVEHQLYPLALQQVLNK